MFKTVGLFYMAHETILMEYLDNLLRGLCLSIILNTTALTALYALILYLTLLYTDLTYRFVLI